MRYATLKTGDLAAVGDGGFVVFSPELIEAGALPPGATMRDMISRYATIKDEVLDAIRRGTSTPADPALLRAPVADPSKIWAAAQNYPRSSDADKPARGTTTDEASRILEFAFFKPQSSIVGPESVVRIPHGAGNIFPEVELCIVIGKAAKDVPPETALEHVFGYTILLDITARQFGTAADPSATRTVRKAFDTFAPLGPWIATTDEVPDPRRLAIELSVNGAVQFSGTSSAMINGVAELVSFFSRASTLNPGDLISTGNPSPGAAGPLVVAGDELRASIEGIGELRVLVDG